MGLGIMQGACGAGFNPHASDKGIAELLALSRAHGVAMRSICADYGAR